MRKANKRKPKSEEFQSDAAEVSDDIQWPSQRELFDAALKLAGDKVFFRDEANLYVKRALWLWLESAKAVCSDSPEIYIKPQPHDYSDKAENSSTSSHVFFEDLKEFNESQSDIWDGVNLPSEYPINFNKALAAVLPRRSTTDRLVIFRQYLRHEIRFRDYLLKFKSSGNKEDYELPDATEVAPVIEEYKMKEFENEGQFKLFARPFIEFYREYKRDSAKKKARKAVKAKLKKKVEQ